MTETKFTPGPYRVSAKDMQTCDSASIATIYCATNHPTEDGLGTTILHIGVNGLPCWKLTPEMQTANAHLFKASYELYKALESSNALITKAQSILTQYLIPDGYDDDEAIIALLELLDGPEQREVQSTTRSSMSRARGEA